MNKPSNIGLPEDQLRLWKSCKPASVLPFHAALSIASSVLNSCTFQNIRKKSEFPSSITAVLMSGCPAGPWLPVNANAPYTLAKPSLYPNGVLYAISTVTPLVGFRSRVFLQDVKLNTESIEAEM